MSYQMRLIDLMTQVDIETPSAKVITGLCLDSRQLKSGDLFFALAANPSIRAQHIYQAIEADIQALCFSADLPLEANLSKQLAEADIEIIAVDNLKAKTARLAAAFYQNPSVDMTIIAVTGTNGKTSVTQFIAQALENAGQPCGVIGTLGCGRLANLKHNGMTTPDPISLQAALAEMRDTGIQFVALEASSHALQQNRLDAVDIDYAVLTNLSRDHLDYHQNMADYAAAKQRLFNFETLQGMVINADDVFGKTLLSLEKYSNIPTVCYSCKDAEATLHASHIEPSTNGLRFNLQLSQQTLTIQPRLLGKFNIENLLATAAVLSLLDWSVTDIANALNNFTSVDGRMQLLDSSLQPAVVVDFAHTPDALAKALDGVRQHMDSQAKLWCVFGCGGDRDSGKRPLMGQIANNLADHVVLTDDNPRSENRSKIIEEILAGFDSNDNVHIENDRQLAIEFAVMDSDLADMVLIAGKGHEQYQEVAGVKTAFNDYEIAMQALQKRHSATRVTL